MINIRSFYCIKRIYSLCAATANYLFDKHYQGCSQDVKSQDRDETETVNHQDRDETETFHFSNSRDPGETFHFRDQDVLETIKFSNYRKELTEASHHAVTVRPT